MKVRCSGFLIEIALRDPPTEICGARTAATGWLHVSAQVPQNRPNLLRQKLPILPYAENAEDAARPHAGRYVQAQNVMNFGAQEIGQELGMQGMQGMWGMLGMQRANRNSGSRLFAKSTIPNPTSRNTPKDVSAITG